MPSRDLEHVEKLKRLILEKKIEFLGSTSSGQWPKEHEQSFRAIDQISRSRWDDYVVSRGGQTRLDDMGERIRNLRIQVKKLRADFGANELAFRETEGEVFKRFRQEAKCPIASCGGEKHYVDFEAEAYWEDEKENLRIRRSDRLMGPVCTGRHANLSGTSDINISGGSEFHPFTGNQPLRHIPDDGLSNSDVSISMKPDRVIGVNTNARYQEAVSSFTPIIDHRIGSSGTLLYPFLVLEAKREKGAPGFRSVEMQTAFPIRSMLHLQHQLRRTSDQRLDPMVWFFAFQGDIWRLYGCTLDNDRVKVFDLWLGSIDTQNGALQIFQIVDFIWSWARDVYRPQIRRCLEHRNVVAREVTPTSTRVGLFSRAGSTVSDRTVQTTQARQVPTVHRTSQREGETQFQRQAANSEDFASRATNGQTCVRRANAIASSIRFVVLSTSPEDVEVLQSINQAGMLFQVSAAQLMDLQETWTGIPSEGVPLPEQSVVGFIFNTFCDKKSWNLHRAITCVIWPYDIYEVTTPADLISTQDSGRLMDFFEPTRTLTGGASVCYAMKDVKFILTYNREPGWRWPRQEWQDPPVGSVLAQHIERCATAYEDCLTAIGEMELLLGSGDHTAHRTTNREWYSVPLLPLPTHVDTCPAMITVRGSSPSWPDSCPRLCLFVLSPLDFDDKVRHRELLLQACREGSFYFVLNDGSSQSLSDEDRHLLAVWARSLPTGYRT